MNEIVSIILPFFGLIALGYGIGRWRKTPAEGLVWLNFFVYYLAVPALFFQFIANAPFEELTNWSFVLTAIFGTYCTFAIAFSIAALTSRGNIPEATMQGLVASYTNSGYMAPGLTLAAFGSAAGVPTALIFGFEYLLLFVLVPMMMALGSIQRTPFMSLVRNIGRDVFLHPFIIAIIVGFVVSASGVGPPKAIDNLLTHLRSAAVPCCLFALGVSLAHQAPKNIRIEMPVLVLIKLIVHPLIVYLLLSWIGGFDPIWVFTAVLMAGLPPAANVYALARQYDVYVEQASTTILVATLGAVFSLTLILSMIAFGTLPINPFY